MAGGNVDSFTSFNNRQLWHLISATGFLRPEEYVRHELEKNKVKLQDGLSFYKTQKSPKAEIFKKESKLSASQYDFILKLSQLLTLDEIQSRDLFYAFLFTQFRGSQKELSNILKNERLCQSLLLKIRDFYYGERIYLLRCLRQILLCWMDDNHAYKEVFAGFLNQLLENQVLGQKLLTQRDELCNAQLPSKETNGPMMSRVQVLAWTHQNLKEQVELLEIMLIYYKDFEMDCPTLLLLCEKFKKHNFGWGQSYKHLVDREMESLIKRIGYLEVLILLEGFDILNALEAAKEDGIEGHIILGNAECMKKVTALISKLGSEPIHGPLLLGWALIQYLRTGSAVSEAEGREDGDTQRKAAARFHHFGNMALQLDVFEFLHNILEIEPFSGKLQVASIAHYVIYSLTNVLLNIFHEDSLKNPEALYRIAVKLFKWEFIADALWDKNNSVGLVTLYESSKQCFPLDFACFMQLNISLASAGLRSSKKVQANLQQLSSYMELLDCNRAQDLQNTQEEGFFVLRRHKYPFQNSDFVIERNTRGLVLNPATLKSNLYDIGHIIKWETNYNCWHLLMGQIHELLAQVSHGAGTVRTEQLLKVSMVMELMKEVMTSDPASVPVFSEVISLCSQLIVRFAVLSPSPIELLGHTIQCLALAVLHFTSQVTHHLKQTGLLPFLTENIDNFSEVLSGDGINPGLYGSILASTECTQGIYSVTTVVLELITQLVVASLKKGVERDHMASVLFVLRDIFPVFHKWRYVNLNHRKIIGMKCLQLFHKILNFANLQEKKAVSPTHRGPNLQECCVFSLLFTEAGRALLEIVATGVDSVQQALAQQASIQEGSGVDLVELIEMSLSLLNRLLLLKHPDLGVSPVENALSSQPAGRQHQHLISTIAQYIYHRHSRRLPTLATVLLKRLAMVSPMSILACLGNEAEPIREMYLARLQAVSEDITLKVRILELLSVCVDSQPGLIEIFLNVQQKAIQGAGSKEGKESEHKLTLGSNSCLPIVLELVETKNQCTYRCPPMLLCAALDFIHSLWAGMREIPMTVLRKEENFWPSILAPLKLDLPTPENNDVSIQALKLRIKLTSLSLRIAALEIYTMSSSSLDEHFSKPLTSVFADSRILYWSKNVKELMQEAAKSEVVEEDSEQTSETSPLNLLLAWKNFLITCGKFKVTSVGLNDSTMGNIFHDLLAGLREQFKASEYSQLKIKLASIASALYFTLIKMWGKTLSEPAAMVRNLVGVVEESCSSCDKLLPSIQIGLMGSITSILQMSGSKLDNLPQLLDRLLPVLCSVFLQSSRQLTSLLDAMVTDQEGGEEEKQTESLSAHIKLQIVSCCLIVEVMRLSSDTSSSLAVIQEQGIVPCILATTESFLKTKQGISYIYSSLLFLTKIAAEENGASMLMMNNLTSHLCLALTSCYSGDEAMQQQPGALAKVFSTLRPNGVSWSTLYCLSLNLFSSMLHTLRHAFLEDALNFIGVHQDRMQQALLQARNNLSATSMQEAEATCNLILQLCAFQRQWRFLLPEVMAKLLGSLMSVIQIYSALLIRPRYLMHMLEYHKGHEASNKSDTILQTPAYLQHQASLDDVDMPSTKLVETQHRILTLVGKGLAALSHLSPDLPEILLDQSVDITEWEPVLGLAFGTPSLDGDPTGITFGTLLYLITVCVRHLAKSDTRSVSPHRVSPDETPKVQIPRHVIHFTMEISLNLLMSQACRYMRDPELSPRERQFLKRELGTELNSFFSSYHRQLRRGAAAGERSTSVTPPQTATSLPVPSLGVSSASTPINILNQSANASTPHQLNRSVSQTSFSGAHDPSYIRLAQSFVQNVLR